MTPTTLFNTRKSLGLSQERLAKILEIPRETLLRWENGTVKIKHGRILELALERLGGVDAVVPVTTPKSREKTGPLTIPGVSRGFTGWKPPSEG